MGHILMTYSRVSSGRVLSSSSHGSYRCFRLNPRRFYVLRLRKRFTFFFLRLFDSWKLSYLQALWLLKKLLRRKVGFKRNNSNSNSSSRSSLVRKEKIKGAPENCKFRSFGRSNSFYAEAIADCLEFIKKTSISMDQIQHPVSQMQDRKSSS